MPSLALVVPGDLATRTGGYGYDRRILAGLKARGWTAAVVALDASFPLPTPPARAHAVRSLAAIPDGSLVMIDGLALGAMPSEIEREQQRLRLVGLVHHPLAHETGLEPAVAAALEVSERRALAAVRHVVVTSRGTADGLLRYGVDRHRVTVVEPGTDPAPLAARDSSSERMDNSLHLLCVASITPRKDHQVLIDALAMLSDRQWQLRCAGALDRDSPTVVRLRARIDEAGLTGRVWLLGDLNEAEVAAEYHRADVFVLPTQHEGYGMAVAEALARGLPVISTPTGAIADLVGAAAGILVAPRDVAGLAHALRRIMDDTTLLAELAAGARRVRSHLPTWDDATGKMAAVLDRVTHDV